MEMKIIKLLNEYEKEKTNQNVRFWNYYQNGFHYLEDGQTYSELLMISKKYEFIKRLVDNDKIDWDNRDLLDECMANFDRYPITFDTCILSDNAVNMLLMLLSIQDESIEFLISILK